MIQGNPLCIRTGEDLALDLQCGAQRTFLDDFNGGSGFSQPAFIIVKDINVPGIPIQRTVLKGDPLIGNGTRREDLSFGYFIEDADDVTRLIDLNLQVIILEQSLLTFLTA